jgi:hypothetical protein
MKAARVLCAPGHDGVAMRNREGDIDDIRMQSFIDDLGPYPHPGTPGRIRRPARGIREHILQVFADHGGFRHHDSVVNDRRYDRLGI